MVTGIKNFFIGVNWDQNRYAGEADIDFDINGFLTDSSRKVVYPEDLVNYKTYEDGSAYPWVDYSGDNKTGDDSQGMIFNGSIMTNILLYMLTHSRKIKQNLLSA